MAQVTGAGLPDKGTFKASPASAVGLFYLHPVAADEAESTDWNLKINAEVARAVANKFRPGPGGTFSQAVHVALAHALGFAERRKNHTKKRQCDILAIQKCESLKSGKTLRLSNQ